MENRHLECPLCGLADLVQMISVFGAMDEPGTNTGQPHADDVNHDGTVERQEAERQDAERQEAEQQEAGRRYDLFFCSRDSAVFSTASGRCVPIERILDLLRPEPAGAVPALLAVA